MWVAPAEQTDRRRHLAADIFRGLRVPFAAIGSSLYRAIVSPERTSFRGGPFWLGGSAGELEGDGVTLAGVVVLHPLGEEAAEEHRLAWIEEGVAVADLELEARSGVGAE